MTLKNTNLINFLFPFFFENSHVGDFLIDFFFLKRNGQGMSKCSSLTIHANFLKTLLHNFFFFK